jgi:hypothetical protein
MGQFLDQLDELKEESVDYAKLKWASVRLAAVDKN